MQSRWVGEEESRIASIVLSIRTKEKIEFA